MVVGGRRMATRSSVARGGEGRRKGQGSAARVARMRPRVRSSARFGRARRERACTGHGRVQSVELRIPKCVYLVSNSRDPHSAFNLTRSASERGKETHPALSPRINL